MNGTEINFISSLRKPQNLYSGRDVFTDDFWFETRSEIFSAAKQANLHMEELIISLRLERKKYQSVCDILVLWGGCGPQGCYVYDSICRAQRFGLLFTKDCECIAALIPCKQKHPVKLSALHQLRTSVYGLARKVVVKLAQARFSNTILLRLS